MSGSKFNTKLFEGKRSRDIFSGHVTNIGIFRIEYAQALL